MSVVETRPASYTAKSRAPIRRKLMTVPATAKSKMDRMLLKKLLL